MDDPASVKSALEGCSAAYCLIHGMSDGADYEEREARSAKLFACNGGSAGVLAANRPPWRGSIGRPTISAPAQPSANKQDSTARRGIDG